MEKIESIKPMIDASVVGEIMKSCPVKDGIVPSDIVRVEGGFAVEVTGENGEKECLYYFDNKGKFLEVNAIKSSLRKTSKDGQGKEYFWQKKAGQS